MHIFSTKTDLHKETFKLKKGFLARTSKKMFFKQMRGNENKKLRLNNIGTRSYFDASFQNLANFQVLIRNTAVIASLLVIAPPMLFATEGFRFEFLGLLKS